MNLLIPMGVGLGIGVVLLGSFYFIRHLTRKASFNQRVLNELHAAEIKAFHAKSKDELRDVIEILIKLNPSTSKNRDNESYAMQVCYYCKGRLEGSPNE